MYWDFCIKTINKLIEKDKKKKTNKNKRKRYCYSIESIFNKIKLLIKDTYVGGVLKGPTRFFFEDPEDESLQIVININRKKNYFYYFLLLLSSLYPSYLVSVTFVLSLHSTRSRHLPHAHQQYSYRIPLLLREFRFRIFFPHNTTKPSKSILSTIGATPMHPDTHSLLISATLVLCSIFSSAWATLWTIQHTGSHYTLAELTSRSLMEFSYLTSIVYDYNYYVFFFSVRLIIIFKKKKARPAIIRVCSTRPIIRLVSNVSADEVVVLVVLRSAALVLHVPAEQIHRFRRARLRERGVLAVGFHHRGDHHGGDRSAVQERVTGFGRAVYDRNRVFAGGRFARVLRAGRRWRVVRAAGQNGVPVRRRRRRRRRTFRRRRGEQSATAVRRQHAGLHERHCLGSLLQVRAGADMKHGGHGSKRVLCGVRLYYCFI